MPLGYLMSERTRKYLERTAREKGVIGPKEELQMIRGLPIIIDPDIPVDSTKVLLVDWFPDRLGRRKIFESVKRTGHLG